MRRKQEAPSAGRCRGKAATSVLGKSSGLSLSLSFFFSAEYGVPSSVSLLFLFCPFGRKAKPSSFAFPDREGEGEELTFVDFLLVDYC